MAASKPSFPWQLPLLGGIAAFGLIAQLVAGEAAFALLERDAPYSWFVAFFIEAAAVIAALEIALSYREIETGGGDWTTSEPATIKRTCNMPAVAVEVVTLLCSAIFNYTWVSRVLTDAHPVQIVAYSVGPLAALSGIGMTTGNALRKWLVELDEWKLATSSQAQATKDKAVAHKHDLDIKAAELQAELAIEAHQAKLAQDALAMELEAKERTRSAKASERIERQRAKVSAREVLSERPVSAHQAPSGETDAQWAQRWATMADFVSDARATPDLVSDMSGADFARLTGKPASTSRRWVAAAQEAVSSNGHH